MSKRLYAPSVAVGLGVLVCLGCGGSFPIPTETGASDPGPSDGAPAVDTKTTEPAPLDLSHGTIDIAVLQAAPEWQQPLMPVFEQAAAASNVPIDLLVTLAKIGSGFENRGDVRTIEGGYGLMALRKNDLGGDSLALAARLTGKTAQELIADPAASIIGAAAVLDSYANEAKVDRSQGIEAWLPAVIKYAGLDEEDSKFFAMGVYEMLQLGFSVTNGHNETFAVSARELQTINLESLIPPGVKRIPLEALEAGVDPDTLGPPPAGKESRLEVDYPGATWDPAASCNYSTAIESKDTIIIHTAEGSAAGTRSWFKNCAAQVSSHYVVSEAGGVWQCVEERYRAWHVGCLNSRSVGIEHEGYASSSSHPAALYNASALLCRNICDRRGIAKAHHTCPPGILGHIDANNCVCGPGHTDPGAGWDWTYFINQINGTNWINPPYLFGGGTDGWTTAHGASPMYWIAPPSWNGAIYFDQTGDDVYIHSPTTNFGGPWAPQTVNVDFYPQNGNTAAHDIQFFWKTNAENYWDAPKSTPVVYYTAQNAWATVNLSINNAKWWGQTVNQVRLDFDQVNHGNRWIINHVVVQDALWWHFDTGNVMGWAAGNSLAALWQTSCCGWPGILVADQTGNDGYMLSPTISGGGWPYNYLGGVNDWIHVRVYPQNGSTPVHDMAVYWIHSGDGTWNEAKSTHVTYTGQDQWVDVYLPVGRNANWPAAHVTQIRLDFDQTNHGNHWIVDYIATEYAGADTQAPSVPGGLSATAASQTQVNLAWTASTDNMGVNGYKVYRDNVQIGTSVAASYSDTTCSPSTTYSYQVSAYDATGNESGKSAPANATTPGGDVQPPSVPTGLTATAVSGTQINLSWTASTDNVGVTGYKVYRGGVQIGTSATTSYSDTTCTPATSYSYTASAYDAAGNNSAQSSPASATTPDTIAPSVPGGLSATAVAVNQINLSWSASTDNVGVTGYKIYRNGSYLTSVAGTSYSNSGLAMGATYSYRVSAYDAANNESGQSAAAEDTTWLVVDNADAGFSASASWSTGTMSTDKYGADYRFRSTTAVSDPATFAFTIPTADNYQVYAWWSQGSNRSTTAPYVVYYNGGSQTVSVNQQINGGVWNSLGTWNFVAGSNNVKLSCWTTTGYVVIADAILVIRR